MERNARQLAYEEKQWLVAWCLLFVFMCVFGSIVDLFMIFCLFGVGACFRWNGIVSLLCFIVYMSIGIGKRHVFILNNQPSLYSLYIRPTVDPLIFKCIQFTEYYIRVMYNYVQRFLQYIPT
jgi:hypothetical protein